MKTFRHKGLKMSSFMGLLTIIFNVVALFFVIYLFMLLSQSQPISSFAITFPRTASS